jgi:hypothetical protein
LDGISWTLFYFNIYPASTQHAAQEAGKEYQRIIAQKDEIIEEQNVKMSYMSTEFESMLNVRPLIAKVCIALNFCF